MDLVDIITYIFIALINLGLAILVYIKNPKSNSNVSLSLFSFSLFLWVSSLFVYHTVENNNALTWVGRFNFATTSLFSLFGFLFITYFPYKLNVNKKIIKSVVVLSTIIIIITTFTPYVAREETLNNDMRSTDFGVLYPLWAAHFVTLVIATICIALSKYKKSTGLNKLQLLYFFLSVITATATGSITNILLPAVFNEFEYQKYGVIATLFVNIPLTYAIVKYKLLNIKFVVGEAIYSIVLVAIPITMYYTGVYLDENLFGGAYTPQAIFLGSTVLVPIFVGIYLLIDRYGKILIYRYFLYSEYNPDEKYKTFFLNTNNDLNPASVINKFINTISKSFNTTTLSIFLKYRGKVIFLNDKDLQSLAHPNLAQKIEDIKDGEVHTSYNKEEVGTAGIEDLFFKNKFELIIISSQKQSFTCFIGIGHKKNQKAYYKHDFKFLEMMVSTFYVAIERALLYDDRINSERILKKQVHQATKEILRQKEILKRKYRQERDMIGIMGHELRTPITIAKSIQQLLIKRLKENKLDKEYLLEKSKRVLNSIRRESELVEMMLEASHVDNKKMSINLSKVNITDIVKEAYEIYKPVASEKNLNLKLEINNKTPQIFTDQIKVGQVINNLISNAVKYTQKGYVKVILDFDKQHLYFSVKDTGPGISTNHLKKLGEKFYRIKQYTNEGNTRVRPGGTGLGLYVVKGILKGLGGKLNIDSEEDIGSTFTAVIPLKTSLNEAETNLQNKQIKNKSTGEDMFETLGFKDKKKRN